MQAPKLLGQKFFDRPTTIVARALLGKFLVRRIRSKTESYMITEVEAYDGPRDRASHASRGKTPRNAVMFGAPGNWYVYLVYGMHEMLNIVTREEGYPAAVLIRGIAGYSGPGKLTNALNISRMQNKKPATRETGLWIEDRGVHIPARDITSTPRIGVDYAGRLWSKKRWRFVISRNALLP